MVSGEISVKEPGLDDKVEDGRHVARSLLNVDLPRTLYSFRAASSVSVPDADRVHRGGQMKVLLRCDVPNVGLAGDVVDVREGYARNFLIPHHMGVEPTNANMKAIEEDKRHAEELRRLRRAELEQEAGKLREVEVTIASACNPEGRLYGSVGPREIASALRDGGHQVETAQVHLREPIRQLDTVMVPVVFAEDIKVEVKVWVVRESTGDEVEEAAPKPQEDREPRARPSTQGKRPNHGLQVDALETDL
jgi:large subunit ribosomal protein L9